MLIVHIFNEIRKTLDFEPLFQLSHDDVHTELEHGRKDASASSDVAARGETTA